MNDFTKLFEQDDEWEKYAVQFLVKVEKEMVDAKGDDGKGKKDNSRTVRQVKQTKNEKL